MVEVEVRPGFFRMSTGDSGKLLKFGSMSLTTAGVLFSRSFRIPRSKTYLSPVAGCSMKNTKSGTKNISLSSSFESSSIDELGSFGRGRRTRSLGRARPPACIMYTRHVDPVFELGMPYQGRPGGTSGMLIARSKYQSGLN